MKLEQNERYDNDGNILVAIYRSDLNGLLHGLGVRERLLQDIKSTLAKLTDENTYRILVEIYRSDLNELHHALGVRERLLQDIKSTLAKLTDENTYRICEKSESMNDAIHNLIESIKGSK